jgi:hypothetical protein
MSLMALAQLKLQMRVGAGPTTLVTNLRCSSCRNETAHEFVQVGCRMIDCAHQLIEDARENYAP